jgi:hypothetical protein
LAQTGGFSAGLAQYELKMSLDQPKKRSLLAQTLLSQEVYYTPTPTFFQKKMQLL